MTNFSAFPSQIPDPAANPHKLAAAGNTVRAKLECMAGIQSLGGNKLDLYLLPQFVDEAECARMVQAVESKIGPSQLFKGTQIDGFRTSSTHHFDTREPVIAGLQSRIADTLGIDIAHAEVMQGQRYLPAQQYKHHFDYFTASQDYWQQERKRGGQRTWTAMICLNEPEAGGSTHFAKPDVSITPKPGTLIVWNNMNRAGQPNPATLHAGMPVEAGRKYVITQWFRQDPWSLHLK